MEPYFSNDTQVKPKLGRGSYPFQRIKSLEVRGRMDDKVGAVNTYGETKVPGFLVVIMKIASLFLCL
jgi:hypothetical protein